MSATSEQWKLLQQWAGVPEDGIPGDQTATALLVRAGLMASSSRRSINAAGLQIIKDSEGLRLKAYVCPAGVLTIGYGSTGPHVLPGMVITEARADALLAEDLKRFEDWVAANCAPTTDNQFSALVSFAFNLGNGALKDSTLRRKHLEGDYAGAANEFGKWVRGGGNVLPGLVTRRRKEADLYRRAG